MKRFLSFLLGMCMLLALAGCGGGSGETEPVQMDISGKYRLDTVRNEAIIDDAGTVTDPAQGNARVFYQIFVGSFSDSNGDGIGDLRGIINRMDYLNDGDDNSGLSLGVEGIWLTPIFASPSYHKYDITNYYKIDPDFGTEEDLKELIALCHERNVKLILDLPINHTATSNTWFQEFAAAHQTGDTASEYYDFYSHSDQQEAGRIYSKIPGASRYYECNFSTEMPELNFDNEAVRQTVVDIARYYLQMGVDGFRFDAAKYVYMNDAEGNAEFWDWYMEQLRAIKNDIYTVAEVWDSDNVTYPYFTATNCFNFSMSQAEGLIAQAAKGGNVNQLTSYMGDYLATIREKNPEAMLVSFVSNHDMDRTAGFLTAASGRARMAANLNILTPGSPFIYYGEEIGMLGSRGGANTDANRRLAMLWGDGDTVKDPVGSSYSAEQANGTVADQLPDGSSLLSHYKKLIAIRKANPAIAYGEYTPVTGTGSKVGGFLASYEGSTVMVLHNTTTDEKQVDLTKLTDLELTQLAACVGQAKLEGTTLTMGPQTSVVLK